MNRNDQKKQANLNLSGNLLNIAESTTMKGKIPDDNQIIEGCIAGKRTFQNMLYQKYARTMYVVCLRYASNHAEAEDLLQEGFVKAFLNIRNYTGKGSFEGWLKRIMINTAISLFIKNKSKQDVISTDDIESFSPIEDEVMYEFPGAAQATTRQLMQLIQELPEGYRMVFSLYAFEGFQHQEIADKLGISVSTSKTQLLKARKYLQKQIDQLQKEERLDL